MTETIVESLKQAILVPVIRTPRRELAERACDWLVEAGCRALEITHSVPEADKVIAAMRERYADVLVGAGTVLTAAEAEASIDAGAAFLVAPCAVPEVQTVAQSRGVPFIPGAATPTEVLARRAEGAPVVKIFPAAQLGGAEYLESLKSVLPDIPLMPTGGVDAQSIQGYLDAGALCVGIGSAIAPRDKLENDDKRYVVDLVRTMLGRCGAPISIQQST